MDGIKIEFIKGTIVNYINLTAESGYCFYDVDNENRNYITSITTPIINLQELQRKYIAVQGNADELNAEIQRRLEEERND